MGAAAGSCILHYIFMGYELIAEHVAEHTNLWGLKLHVCVPLLNFHKDWDVFKKEKKERKKRNSNRGDADILHDENEEQLLFI